MADASARPDEQAQAGDGPTPAPPVCPVALCPVGLVLTAAGQARPEVVQHLLSAGSELLMAVKALIDARLEPKEEAEPLQRITIE